LTPLGIVFSTDENMVAQADVNFIETTIESLVVEFDQAEYEDISFQAPKA